jgi:hypothetical protein
MVVLVKTTVDDWNMHKAMPVLLPHRLPKQAEHHQSRLPHQPFQQQQQPSRRWAPRVQLTPHSPHCAFGRQEGKGGGHNQIQRRIQRVLRGPACLVTPPGPGNAISSIHMCRTTCRGTRLDLPAFRFFGPPLVEADVKDRVRGQVAQEDDQEGSNGVRGEPKRHGK